MTLREYKVFKDLEDLWYPYFDQISIQPDFELVLKDGQKIKIKGATKEPYEVIMNLCYIYTMSRFGVVRQLQDPWHFDKSPLCIELDHLVLDMFASNKPRILR
jgi:hypothetical protein